MPEKVKTLITERLILNELVLDHAPDYQKGFADYNVIRHMNAAVPWPYSDNGVEDFLTNTILPFQGKSVWAWAIFFKEDQDNLIGSISLRISDKDNRGFWLAHPYWGHGYMTEAADAVNAHAFHHLGFEKLLLTNAKGNHRSRRVKEKTGARLVSVVPTKAVDSSYTEAEQWELLKEEWLKRQDAKP